MLGYKIKHPARLRGNVLTSDFFISHEAVCFSFMGLGKAVLYAFVEEFIFRLMPFMLIWGFYYTNHPLKHFWLILIVCASSIIFGYIHIGSLHPVVIQGGLGLIMYLCFLLGGVFRGRLLSSFWGVTIGHAMYNISIGSFGGSCG